MPLEQTPKYRLFNPFKKFHTLQIPEGVARYRGLSPGAKLIYGRLYRYAGQNGCAFPKIETLAEEVGLGTRQTQTYVAELQAEDFIFLQRRYCQRSLYLFQDHPALTVGETGSPRWGSIHQIDSQDTADQFSGVVPQDTAVIVPQDTAVIVPQDTAGLNTRGSVEEGQEDIPPTPIKENHAPSTMLYTESYDADGEPIRTVAQFKKQWPKKPKPDRPHGNSDRLRAMRESGPPANDPPSTATTPHKTPPAVPALQSAPSCIEIWNANFPDRAVNPAVYSNGTAPYPIRDGSLAAQMEAVVKKCRWLIDRGADIQFGMLVRKESNGVYGYAAVLTGDKDWLCKKHKIAGESLAQRKGREAREKLEAIERARTGNSGIPDGSGTHAGVPRQ